MIDPTAECASRGKTTLGRFENFFGYGIFRDLGSGEWEHGDPEEITTFFIQAIKEWQTKLEKSYAEDSARWFRRQKFFKKIWLLITGKSKLEYPTLNFLIDHTCKRCREFSDWSAERNKPISFIARPLQVASLLQAHKTV